MSPAVQVAFAGALGAFRLDAAFSMPASGVTALFGPSGCGKTTVLRCIAGLQRLERGLCVVGDETWQDAALFRPAHRRAIGYVFQEASLFGHLSVRRNLLYGASAGPIAFDDVVALLGLEPLLGRAPAKLSGGERQRVAIGRALLSQPRLMLMDEPLSALDRDTRAEVLPFLALLPRRLSLPILYVSHDLAEVEQLADHMVLMQAGSVLASGPLSALQSDPALPLARGRDAAVSLDGTVAGFDPPFGLLRIETAGAAFLVPSPPVEVGMRRRLRIAARDVSVALGDVTSTIVNLLPAQIVSITPVEAHEALVLLGLGADGTGARVLARVTTHSLARLGLTVGQRVQAQIKAVALV